MAPQLRLAAQQRKFHEQQQHMFLAQQRQAAQQQQHILMQLQQQLGLSPEGKKKNMKLFFSQLWIPLTAVMNAFGALDESQRVALMRVLLMTPDELSVMDPNERAQAVALREQALRLLQVPPSVQVQPPPI